ncbi:hypothetical protein Ccrd_025414 [Cynara cardunculus var. scolymus]|uniref:Transposase-associated domain-containing protein n=1 Tax=Cynara cardunculus var. scolymus TaxID=59895 RepID=A0A124SAG4_CYNCS|nr:hypothetical protein Ccrd_025414 [Cynara cardunculus var. scolymus]
MIRAHILRYGMLATYQRWIHHGESLSDEEEQDHFEDSSNNDEDDHTLRDVIMDEKGCMFFNVDHSTENDVEDKSDVNRGRFDKSDVEPTNCEEDEFMNDDDEDNESEDVEPMYESEDRSFRRRQKEEGGDTFRYEKGHSF